MHGKYTSTALTLAIQRKEEKRREQRRHSFLMLPISQVANNKRMQGMYRENHFFLIVPENWSSWYCEDLFLSWLTHFLMCAEVNKRTSVISQHYFFFVTPGNWNGWRYDFLSFLYIYIYVFHIYAEFNRQYFFFPFFLKWLWNMFLRRWSCIYSTRSYRHINMASSIWFTPPAGYWRDLTSTSSFFIF